MAIICTACGNSLLASAFSGHQKRINKKFDTHRCTVCVAENKPVNAEHQETHRKAIGKPTPNTIANTDTIESSSHPDVVDGKCTHTRTHTRHRSSPRQTHTYTTPPSLAQPPPSTWKARTTCRHHP